MHCLRLYKTSFQNRISMPKPKNCICQALEFASRQNPKKNASRRSAETELQNTIELRTTASEIVAPKPSRAAKDNSITNAATARRNLDTAITMQSAETELQNTIELRTTASEIVAPKPDSRRQSEKKTILQHFLKGFLEGKSLAPKWRKSADKSLWQPSCSHSNTIYEIELQRTMVK